MDGMIQITEEINWSGVMASLYFGRYSTNMSKLALILVEKGEPYCRVSVNTPDELEEDEFVVHHDFPLELLRFATLFMAPPVFEDTGKRVTFGFTGGPVLRLVEYGPIARAWNQRRAEMEGTDGRHLFRPPG